MRRRIVPILAPVLAVALAACSGAAQSSPSAAPSVSSEPSMPNASPSAAASASAGATATATTSAEAGSEVVGVEYAYENVPDTVAVGTELGFRNGGAEAHEMVLARKNAGVTTSFEELLAMPEEESSKLVTFVGQLMANPGETAESTLAADAPGDYLMICFFPQGWTEIPEGTPGPDASLPAGAPHFTLGMLKEFTVE